MMPVLTRAESDLRQPIILKVQGLPNDASVDPPSIAEQRVIARFHELYPNIAVQGAEGLQVENMNAEATTMMMIAGGIGPDVIRMNFRSSDTFIRQGIAAPLDSFIAKAASEGDDVLASVPKQIIPLIQRKDEAGIVQTYGLPTQMLVSGLYFNRELFREAGLPPRAPRDWEELVAFAKKINNLGSDYHGFVLPAGASASFHLMNFIRAAGGDAVAEVSPSEWRAVFNSPEASEAYLFYYRLVEGERVAYRAARGPTAEEMKSIGMMFRYVGDVVQLDPAIWEYGAIPKGSSGKGGSEINASILCIFSGITDTKRRLAAWNYIRFVTGEEANRIRTATLVELGQANLLNPLTLRKFGFNEHLVMAQQGLEEEFTEALRDGKPEPYGKNCNLIYLELTYPLDQILLSQRIKDAWKAGDMESARREVQAILDRAVVRTNERMIGHVDPDTMKRRRVVAGIVVTGILSCFVGVGWYMNRSFTQTTALASRPVNSKSLVPWICLFPAAALVLVWEYLPLIRGTQIAFLDYQVILESTFVGLDNFASVLFNVGFWNSILVTGYFAGLNLTFGFAAPILLAYMLHLIPKGKIGFRTIYYLPAVISSSAVYFLWKALFDGEGIMNQILRIFGFEATRAWTQDPYFAMFSCVLPGIWAAAGPGCLIYLAALKTIPEEIFEASEIDGAGFFHKTVYIVFPGLKALIIINFIGAISAAFQTSTNILIMTGGGPNGATEVTSLLIFYEAFSRLRFGTATAMAWIIGSMLLGFTVIQLRRLNNMEFKTTK